MKKIILFAAIIFCYKANAQTVTAGASQDASLALTDVIEISFVATGTDVGNNINFSFTNVNKYKNGITSGAQAIKVRSNKNFTVQVKANADYFSYAGSTIPAPTMPVTGVLSAKVTANSTGGSIVSPFNAFGDLSSTGQKIIDNGTAGGNQQFSVKYKAEPGFSYPAGTYTVNIIYTATQS